MKKRYFIALAFLGAFSIQIFAQDKKVDMAVLIEEQFANAAVQYKLLEKNVPDTMMPKTLNKSTGKVEVSNTKWWCSGFFPGSLLYIFEHTQDQEILRIAKKRLAIQEKEKHYTGNHDLGFMMFNPFGNAYRLFKNPADKTTIDTAAMSLITRYRPEIKSIQSWNKNKNFNCPVIIDNMMNLEFLFWAAKASGNKSYYNLSVTHADNTLKNHFRVDNSSYHVVCYDTSGKVLAKKTHQGASDESAWARGQAWGLYGYTVMYRETKDKKYLNHAHKIAKYILTHPNLPADKIPYWDFSKVGEERDASAAAIISTALFELSQYSKGKQKNNYISSATQILESLTSSNYKADVGENNYFLLKHSTGHKPNKSEIDVPIIYADYYYLEALLRYSKLSISN
jgi:rhamnogalacturonyl hydrolase YesR